MTDFAYAIGQALLACLQTNVVTISVPPQHVRLAIGDEQAHDIGLTADLCCEGLAYVALGDTYPSTESFPEEDIIRQVSGSCHPAAWAQIYKVGIIRCAPVSAGPNSVDPPTDAQWTAAALLNYEDTAALRRTACCFRAWMAGQTDVLVGMSVVIQRQQQSTPAGGCVERTLTLAAQFPNCDCV